MTIDDIINNAKNEENKTGEEKDEMLDQDLNVSKTGVDEVDKFKSGNHSICDVNTDSAALIEEKLNHDDILDNNIEKTEEQDDLNNERSQQLEQKDEENKNDSTDGAMLSKAKSPEKKNKSKDSSKEETEQKDQEEQKNKIEEKFSSKEEEEEAEEEEKEKVDQQEKQNLEVEDLIEKNKVNVAKEDDKKAQEVEKNVEVGLKDKDLKSIKEDNKSVSRESVTNVVADPSISSQVKLSLLCSKIIASLHENGDSNPTIDSILQLLITEDLQRIKDSNSLNLFFRDYLKQLPLRIVAEILSVLIAVLKKSLLNLEAAKNVLLDCLLHYFVKSSDAASDNLIKHFLREIINHLASYSCDVQELKCLLTSCQKDPRLLHIIRCANVHQRSRPNAFFAFPGSRGSVLALPPLHKWPIQNGWTFVTWFRLEPNSINSQPYLYFFRTSKSGVGYSAHFTGNCLVLTSMKIKSKGYQHCIPYEFSPFKWYHCAVVYVTKWRGTEIKVFVNGQMTANTEMSWQVQTQDVYDRCFIGGTADLVSESHLFSGQLSAIYIFHEALNPSQICAIHRLGPRYMGQYRYSNEMALFNTPFMMKKVLYEEKLSNALICLYTPVAVEGETLCLQSSPKGNISYFTSSPHAALLGQTRAVITKSISDTLQSIGGIKALFPLLNRFTGSSAYSPDPEACSTLIGFICNLLESSPLWFGNEVVQSHGFVIISSLLAKNSRLLIQEETLDIILTLIKTLMSTISFCSSSSSEDNILLKQLMNSLLFNPSLWIYVDAKLQIRLYCYLATEFLSAGTASSTSSNCDMSSNICHSSNDSFSGSSSSSSGINVIFSEVRRISTILQLLHSLKYYYWLVPEDNLDSNHSNTVTDTTSLYQSSSQTIQVKARESSLRPSKNDLISIRSYMLLFIKQLIIKGNGAHQDELQAILNYLSTVYQDDNLLDVLQMLQSLMVEHPSSMIPSFDMKQGIRIIFKLIDSKNEEIRIQTIKLMGSFLSRSTAKRKQDVMGPNNLFMLLCEKLLQFTPLSIDTYNALFEILVETSIETVRSNDPNTFLNLKIENPMILKVLASLINDGKKIAPQIDPKSTVSFRFTGLSSANDRHDRARIKKLFINDLWRLLVNNRENRRLVLQMSVWQHWLINLIEDRNDQIVCHQILAIFRILLYHAIKYEYGGWRVWIDTLAIIHAKVSFDDFMSQFDDDRKEPSSSACVKESFKKGPLSEAGVKETKNIIFENQQSTKETKPLSLAAESSENVKQEDQQANIKNEEQTHLTITEVKDKPASESAVSKDDVPEKGNNETETVEEPAISTISSSTQPTGPSIDDKIDDNDPNQRDESKGKEVPDLAPTRSYRKSNNYKEFQAINNFSFSKATQQHSKSLGSLSATPAFRIPEFRWSKLHLKLLNDLLYSIECDLQMWRSQGAKDASGSMNNKDSENKSGIMSISAAHLEQILQHQDHQTYIANAIHLVSQLCDNIIIAAGGLLPLLATATGGNSNSSGSNNDSNSNGSEGFTLAQANFLLYRLVNLADILCFAATHINFSELEAEKNMSSGGILRQCLRLVCTVAVKNCLTVQKHQEVNSDNVEAVDPANASKDIYNLGTSISAAAELFGGLGNLNFSAQSEASFIDPSLCDITANSEMISGSFPPLQPLPIKDMSKLLQEMDVNRLRACIYRDSDADAKQSQFLALASLYFISVLMVSEYRDIIEPKVPSNQSRLKQAESEKCTDQDLGTSELGELKSIKTKMNIDPASIGDLLISKLETRLSSVCLLLREIMCDFATFLSKTLLGSHGQDLVSKEAVRTFRRPNASSVELVMLLCSQEWQNTLQKNAGLAFIELINEGRLLSHAMKDHIVRVAMEAEFILNRLRADDVAKHEQFNTSCNETMNVRNYEENLINSLINSAKRRDRMIYTKFKENLIQSQKREDNERYKIHYKLDNWEDDARRRRRFVLDLNEEDNHTKSTNSVKLSNEPAKASSSKNGQQIPAHLLFPKQPVSTTREGSDEENELFLWESDDLNSNISNEIDDRPPSAVELAGAVLYTVECHLIWNIYAIEGTLQITANEFFFEANHSTTPSESSLSHGKSQADAKCATNRNTINKDQCFDENLKGLSGYSSGQNCRNGFKDLDLKVLRYCDLLVYNGKVSFSEIKAVFSRKYLLQQNAIEIFLCHRTSVMFAFADFETVKKVIKYLPAVGIGIKYGISQSRRASLMTPKQLFTASNMTQKWQKREISNFEYLMFLNTIAGRSFQDLNQYPIFPWILTNYDSPELDLAQPTNFRDLSKPIGALNSERRAEFIERYNSWDNNIIPAFHYGTHYSTAAFTLAWLIRLEPFYSAYMALQDGRLEDEARLFTSIHDSWLSSLMGGQQNVKELIPEMFYLPEVLTGAGSQVNLKLHNVELPNWAESSQHFIRLHRLALESELVSCQLHQWIDLIFGYKQKGPEAVRAVNVFYYLTYEGNVDLSQLSSNDPTLKEAIEAQIRHFGQTPSQLTNEPHPPRSSALHVSPLMFSPIMDEICMSIKFSFNASIVHIAACCSHNSSAATVNTTPSMIVTINSSQSYHIHKWNPKESNQPFTIDPTLSLTNSSSSSSSSNKRHLIDTTSLCCISSPSASFSPCYIVTVDSKHIIMAPFYDNSFRVYSTDTGKLTQVIYGHRGLVTCLARSECNVVPDFYLASGSKDCCVLFWTWNSKYAQIEGTNGSASLSSNPLPKLTLTGHETEIQSLVISAELGLIVSGSKFLILVHTITNGDCVCNIDIRKRHLSFPLLPRFEKNEKEADDQIKANLEASMLGQAPPSLSSTAKERKTSPSLVEKSNSLSANSRYDSSSSDTDEDYIINNLVIAREPGLIVGTAFTCDKSGDKRSSSTKPQCILFTYNLRGELHKCITFSPPKEATLLLMTITLDGEYIILNESQHVIKIIRTFDMTPLCALNTSDVMPNFLGNQEIDSSQVSNCIKSLLLVDYKYLLVGTDNGRLIIYRLDFNRWHHEYSSRY